MHTSDIRWFLSLPLALSLCYTSILVHLIILMMVLLWHAEGFSLCAWLLLLQLTLVLSMSLWAADKIIKLQDYSLQIVSLSHRHHLPIPGPFLSPFLNYQGSYLTFWDTINYDSFKGYANVEVEKVVFQANLTSIDRVIVLYIQLRWVWLSEGRTSEVQFRDLYLYRLSEVKFS